METGKKPSVLSSIKNKLTQRKLGIPIWTWILFVAIIVIVVIIVIVSIVKKQQSYSVSLTSRESFTRLNKGNGNPMQSFVDDWIQAELGSQS